MRKGTVSLHLALVALASLFAQAACAPSVGSIGAVLGQDRASGRVLVRDAPPGMAAAKAGLREGDEIVSIEGQDVRDLPPNEVAELLRGEVGSEVHVTVIRGGTEVIRTNVVRGPFKKR